MKKSIVLAGVVLLVSLGFSPLSVFADEQNVPVVEQRISQNVIPEGTKDITTINFNNGLFSPDVYVSSRLINLVIWSGGGAVSVMVAAIPGLGIQMAQAAVEAIKGYSGTINNGIIIHFHNGLVEYISAQ